MKTTIGGVNALYPSLCWSLEKKLGVCWSVGKELKRTS